jgi:bacillolysin
MKTTFLKQASSAIIFTLSAVAVYAQHAPKAFDVKKHRDTLLTQQNLNAQLIQRPSGPLLSGASPGGSKKSMATSFAGNQGNFRKDGTVVITAEETGLPLFISSPSTATARLVPQTDKQAACYSYLESIASYLQMEAPAEHFNIQSVESDNAGKTHIKLTQKYKGVKVYNAQVIVHLNAGGIGEAFNGRYQRIKQDIDMHPGVSASQALNTVLSDLSQKTKFRELNSDEKSLLDYEGPVIDTIVYTLSQPVVRYVLAYHVTVKPNLREHWEYFVDAKTSGILQSYQNICAIDGPRTANGTDLNGVSRQLNTYQQGTGYMLLDVSQSMFDPTTTEGAIVTLDANKTFGADFKVKDITSTDNQWLNPAAVSAHYNAHIAYDFYKNTYGRVSINGKGGTIISVVNVVDEDGTELDNAYWNGKAMFYGNGNILFKSLAGGLDVGGHEMTHGVVQNTANLDYQGESGAINESMADIFGFMMDSTDWLLGEDVVNKQFYPSGALRSLQDPHNGGNSLNDRGYQPKQVNEQYLGSQDNGGVHINSGIPNHAFYLLANAIGKVKAAGLFYKALSTYLTQNAQFIDLRLAVIQSAKDVYGGNASEVIQVGLAFDGVGITEKVGGVYTSTIPVNPGDEYLLGNNTGANSNYGLFRASSPTSAEGLLMKIVGSKPSVTDDGNYCVFVGTDKKIYVSNVNPNNTPTAVVFEASPIWSNVAVSKDGKRIAAVTGYYDTSIYVYDFEQSQWARFMLYNPTFSDIRANGVLYADALEWDYTGERLVYDAYNSIQNPGGDNIEYWDINFIQVYDNALKTFSDGTIFKLISNLELGESIGNPSISKTSPNIIAFDYVNESDPNNVVYGIIGFNTELNDLGGIVRNNTLGFPSYNKTDEILAFTSIDANQEVGINYVHMNADKISSSGIDTVLFLSAKWPVFYAVGNRDYTTGTEDQLSTSNVLSTFPNPVRESLNVTLPELNGNAAVVELYNSLGVSVLQQALQQGGETNQLQLQVADLPTGVYTLMLRSGKNLQSTRVVKY